MKTDSKTVTYLLNLANDMRKAKGDDSLEDLPKSIPSNAYHCIIANAFNYGCSVEPDEGVITFQSVEDVDTYFKVMELHKDDYMWVDDLEVDEDDPDTYPMGLVLEHNQAPMTTELIEIALEFDAGMAFMEYVDPKTEL